MMKPGTADSCASERIIAEGIVDVASELRLLEVPELVAMIRREESLNIADLVNSSTELYFRSGALRYASCADYCVQWDTAPVIILGLEFRHPPVSVLFRLLIGRRSASVELLRESYDLENLSEDKKIEILTEAIAKARLPAPNARRFPSPQPYPLPQS
jgi:hypothetical protein